MFAEAINCDVPVASCSRARRPTPSGRIDVHEWREAVPRELQHLRGDVQLLALHKTDRVERLEGVALCTNSCRSTSMKMVRSAATERAPLSKSCGGPKLPAPAEIHKLVDRPSHVISRPPAPGLIDPPIELTLRDSPNTCPDELPKLGFLPRSMRRRALPYFVNSRHGFGARCQLFRQLFGDALRDLFG